MPAPDVFGCLRNQLKTTGFSQSSLDQGELRFTARKIDEEYTVNRTRSSAAMIDRIAFDVEPGTGGNITEIIGEASSFAEYSTERGPTEEQHKASDDRDAGGPNTDRQAAKHRWIPSPRRASFRPIHERRGTAGPIDALGAGACRASHLPRKPSWLKVKAPGGANYVALKGMMRELGLHTVCEEARCPNIGECWEHKAATFMILGDVCTRNCAYCAVAHGTPTAFDPVEPVRLAEAVQRMGLEHVVITSVDRDDLPNGGAEAFAGCITEIRRRLPETSVEVLIPDFKGSEPALRIVMDVAARHPQSQSRDRRAALPPGPARAAATTGPSSCWPTRGGWTPTALTKSGIILGMGEEWDEILACLRDLRRSDVNILTLGQYLRPSERHLPVARYYTPDEFDELRDIGLDMGFTHVQASPLTRSSYHAWEQARGARRRGEPADGAD